MRTDRLFTVCLLLQQVEGDASMDAASPLWTEWHACENITFTRYATQYGR